MFFKRIMSWFKKRLTPPATSITEEEYFQQDTDELDREVPSWDREARIARARSLLDIGMPRDRVREIYGECDTAAAERCHR
jgi:hypothetical protein